MAEVVLMAADLNFENEEDSSDSDDDIPALIKRAVFDDS
jgi:hypothetical protein